MERDRRGNTTPMIGLRNTAVTVMATVYVAAILCGCGDRQDVVEDPSLRLSADTPQPTVVAYKRIDGQELTAHVFLPADWKATDRRPAYLWLHGGGFVVGSPEAGYDVAEVVAARGIVGISVQYRLAVLDVPGTKIDAQIADAKSIVRWVRRRAGQLGVDPERIVGGGHSAGAFLMAAAGIVRAFEDPGDDDVSPVPDALLLWSAPITLDDPFVPRILPPGVELGDVVPSQHVRPGLPPSVFIHGSEDRLVPPTVSIELSAALRAAGNRSEVWLIPGGDHFFIDPVLREALLDETVAALGGL